MTIYNYAPYYPNASGWQNYTVNGIGSAGQIYGNYYDGSVHGGYVSINGVNTPINPLGGTNIDIKGVNSSGQIAGRYFNGNTYNGFVSINGSATNISPLGSKNTYVLGISDAGQIVGSYEDYSSISHNFIYSNGTVSDFTPFGSKTTSIIGINPAGKIFGFYYESGIAHSFVYSGGSSVSYDVTNAALTLINGITNSGQIYGRYIDTNSKTHGFVNTNGIVSTIDAPGAITTAISGLTASGQIIGTFTDANNKNHTFIDDAGTFTTIDYPNYQNTFSPIVYKGNQVFALATDANYTNSIYYTASIAQPVVQADSALTVIGRIVSGTGGRLGTGLLKGDSDPNGYSLTVSNVEGGSVGQSIAGTYGHITINVDGSYSYNADNYAALTASQTSLVHDKFNYTVINGHGGEASSSIDITIEAKPPTISIVRQDISITPDGKTSGILLGRVDAVSDISVHVFDGNKDLGSVPQIQPFWYANTPGTAGTHNFHIVATDGAGSTDLAAPISVVNDTLIFHFNLNDTAIGSLPNVPSLTLPNGSLVSFSGGSHFVFNDGTINQNTGPGALVDNLFYYTHNHEVWNAHTDPTADYNATGWKVGRDPNANFSTNGYLAANPDVAKAGLNPLSHYDTNGWKEGRDPSANFDNELYLARNPDVKAGGLDPLAHYLQYGQAEGRQAYAAVGKAVDLAKHPGFDAEYYLLSNADVAKAALSAGGDTFAYAYQHYANYGWHEGRNPNAVFDTKGYLAAYADVKAANLDPLTHYDQYGFKEGRDPSAHFDTKAYQAAYGDIKAAGLDPMLHYLQYGAVEGRTAFDDGHFA